MCFELMRHHCDITAIFEKHSHFCNDVTCGSNFVPRFNSWYWIKCLIQSNCVTKTCCDVVLVKFSPKNAQISESDFGKHQNWETSRDLSNFKVSWVICDKIWLKFKLIRNKNLVFWRDLSQKKKTKKALTCKIGLTYSKNASLKRSMVVDLIQNFMSRSKRREFFCE